MPQLHRGPAGEQALRLPSACPSLKAVCRAPRALAIRWKPKRATWTNFDRGRQTSLHLFEHVHGDSRDRGPALIDLMQTYEKAGLQFEADELPDHLPVVLEFASTQPPKWPRSFWVKWPTSSMPFQRAAGSATAPMPA
jgi:nitrate reductase delta subunit